MKRQIPKKTQDSTILIEKRKPNEEWKKFSFRSAANDGIDCGDKQCYLEYRVMPDCYLILETNQTDCRIPCIMDGCDRELHHFIPCPLWNCELITTSTTSTTSTTPTTRSTSTSTSTTTSRPTPRPNEPSQMSALIYTSIVLNIFFFAILFAYVVVKCRVKITTRVANFRARRNTPRVDPNPNEHFSVGGSDDEELGIDAHVQAHERQLLLPPDRQPIASHGSVDQGQQNLAFDQSNDSPQPSTSSNWQNFSRAILGEDPIPNINSLPMPSGSNWQDVSLASSSSQTSIENTGASLNTVEPKSEVSPPEKSIFMRMKTFRKK